MAVKKQISQKDFENLCKLQCTKLEMCEFLRITDKTLDRWIHDTYGADKSFSEIFALKRQAGVISMRRNLYKMSKTSFNALRFWMINHADMKDKTEVETTGSIVVVKDDVPTEQ